MQVKRGAIARLETPREIIGSTDADQALDHSATAIRKQPDLRMVTDGAEAMV